MSTYDHIKCPLCFVPWEEHTPDCSRHEFRPGARAVMEADAETPVSPAPDEPPVSDTPDVAVLVAMLRRIYAESEPRTHRDLITAGAISCAADMLERLHRAGRDADEATRGMASAVAAANDASIELLRLRAAIDRLVAEAVGRLGDDPRGPWEWSIGRNCSCTFDDRADAVAAFRERFGLENGRPMDAHGLRLPCLPLYFWGLEQ